MSQSYAGVKGTPCSDFGRFLRRLPGPPPSAANRVLDVGEARDAATLLIEVGPSSSR